MCLVFFADAAVAVVAAFAIITMLRGAVRLLFCINADMLSECVKKRYGDMEWRRK